MSEKETVKPKRKKKISEPGEKTAAEKTGKSKKAAAPAAESTDFVIDPVGKLKPAKKPKTAKKTLVELTEKTAGAGGGRAENVAPETFPAAAAAAGISAESVQAIEELTGDSAPEIKPRKKSARKTPPAASSDSLIKKKSPRAKKEKPLPAPGAEILLPIIEEAEKQVSSPGSAVSAGKEAAATEPATETGARLSPKKEESPIFKELAEPRLPVLPEENRARLQMQSPNRIFLYWSIKHNPFESIHRAFPGRAENYRLTVKLVNLTENTEQIFPIESSGSWWFNVEANASYRAEIGFFASGSPFVRLMFSNTVQTPRSAPSPNRDWSTDFAVSANKFAEVLEASGYAQDAFEVAVAGEEAEASDSATEEAFFRLAGVRSPESGNTYELRSVLFALAAGVSLEHLRGQISPSLYARLEAIVRENAERLSSEKVLAALHENFAFEGDEEEFLIPVFGASSINFPKKLRRPKFLPISSLR